MTAANSTSYSVNNFQFYSRTEYFSDLAKRISALKKGDSVTLMTMSYDPRVPSVASITDSLCQAASRGASVRLIVDALSFMLADNSPPGPLCYSRSFSASSPQPYGEIFQCLEQLRAAGGEYHVINRPLRPLSNPYAGRSHIKLGIINDRVYIPSCNLDNDNYLDLTIAWQDAATANWLRQLTDTIAASGSVKAALNSTDLAHSINDRMILFVDSGVKRQSLIYQHALERIDQANKNMYITCQYFPGGDTAQHMLAAQKRGADLDIRYSHPLTHGKQYLGQSLYNLRERARLWSQSRSPKDFFSGRLPANATKLHAKLLATENGALSGSHNYVAVGVNFGTAEIALEVRDPAFAKAAVTKMTDIIRQAIS